MKEYSLQEVFDLPKGTEFKVKYEKGNYNKATVKLVQEKGFLINSTKLVWENGEDIQMKKEFITAKFIKVQESVSFMDVVNSNKKCTVEYGNYILTHFESFRDLILILIDSYGEIGLKKAIKEGKWYLESEVDE